MSIKINTRAEDCLEIQIRNNGRHLLQTEQEPHESFVKGKSKERIFLRKSLF